MKKCFYCNKKIKRSDFSKMTNYNWNLKNYCDVKCKKNYWNSIRPSKKRLKVESIKCLNCEKTCKVIINSQVEYCSLKCKKSYLVKANKKAKEMRETQNKRTKQEKWLDKYL